MKRIALVSMIACAALLPLAAHAEEATVVASPAALKWHAAPAFFPKGTEQAVLFGDPRKEGPFVTRTKFPAGSKIMPHTHPQDENITVISGSAHLGFGDQFDPKKGILLKAGGFFHNPKGSPHYIWFTETTVIQNNSVGPFGRTPVNAAENAAKSK